MLDFEYHFRRLNQDDPDSYLDYSEPRRENLRRWIADLFLYDIDETVDRRREVDGQLPSRRTQAGEDQDEDEDPSADKDDDGDDDDLFDASVTSSADDRDALDGVGNSSAQDQQADPPECAIYDEQGFLRESELVHGWADGEEDWDTTQGTVNNAT